MSHIVDAVQVALALLVVHVLAPGLHNLDGVMAEEDLAGRPAKEPLLLFHIKVAFTDCAFSQHRQ